MTYICDHESEVLARLHVLISTALLSIYQQKFSYDPRLGFSRVRDLTFLPHLLEIGRPVKYITIEELVERTLGPTHCKTVANLKDAQPYNTQTVMLQRHIASTTGQPDQPKQRLEGAAKHLIQAEAPKQDGTLNNARPQCGKWHPVVPTPATHVQHPQPRQTHRCGTRWCLPWR